MAPRVLVTGSQADHVLGELRASRDVQVVDARRVDAATVPVDVVIHAAGGDVALDRDLASIRQHTRAPVILAVAGTVNGLLEDALRAGVRDVLLLPQPVETLLFAIRKATADPALSETREGRIVAVTSPKGGTGKTAVATNLAAAIARAGSRTLLVDLDLQFGDAAVMLGVRHTRTIVDLAGDAAQLDREKLLAFAVVDERSGAAVVPGPHRPEEAESVRDAELSRLLAIARSTYDAVVVDTAPLFDRAMLLAIDAADEVLVVCTPEIPSLKNTKVALETLDRLGVPQERITVVLNRVGGPAAFGQADVEHTLGVPVGVLLPDDPAVPEAVNRSTTAVVSHPGSRFAKAVGELAAAVAAGPEPHAVSTRRRFRIGGSR